MALVSEPHLNFRFGSTSPRLIPFNLFIFFATNMFFFGQPLCVCLHLCVLVMRVQELWNMLSKFVMWGCQNWLWSSQVLVPNYVIVFSGVLVSNVAGMFPYPLPYFQHCIFGFDFYLCLWLHYLGCFNSLIEGVGSIVALCLATQLCLVFGYPTLVTFIT